MKSQFFFCFIFFSLSFSFVSHAAITIDGRLDEPEWQSAQVFDNFITIEPLTLEKPPYRTQARLMASERGIYIGIKNYQPEQVVRIKRKFSRDSSLKADHNVINIDFDGDGKVAYDFAITSSNSVRDGIVNNENQWSKDWDGIWYHQTSEDSEAWYSEILIPWSVAPMADVKGDYRTIGVYFSRIVYSKTQRYSFPNATADRPVFVSALNKVKVANHKQGSFDIFPYITSISDIKDEKQDYETGLDLVWRPNSNQQLTATINPDFGQVESDDVVVNFSAIESFFSEKRPFFTENQALFSKEMPNDDRMLHTRRIGAATDAGDKGVSDILGAVKYTHFGRQFDYGVFGAVEDDTDISDGRQYLTTRVQSKFENATAGHSLNYVKRDTLEREAVVNALDIDWQISGRQKLSSQLLHSKINQSANSINNYQEQDQSDIAGWLWWEYNPNENWTHDVSFVYYGKEFDMNDSGFLERNSFQELSVEHTYLKNSFHENSLLQTIDWDIEYYTEYNAKNDHLGTTFSTDAAFILKSSAKIWLDAWFESAGFDDLITRGNGLLKTKMQNGFSFEYQSPRQGKVNYEVDIWYRTRGTDKRSINYSISPKFYLTENFSLILDFDYLNRREWLIWDARSDQLGLYDAKELQAEIDLEWFPAPKQEIRLKFQWIGLKSDGIAGYLPNDEGRRRLTAIPLDDFSLSTTALQLRYRYELAPLSDVFLVYSRGGNWNEDRAVLNSSNIFDQGWDQVTAESVVFKVRYRF